MNWKARGRVTASMSAARSMTAPCPPKIAPDARGATTARVNPSARLMPIDRLRGLTAGTTSSAALKGDVRARLSSVSCTPSTSTIPKRLNPAKMPGDTQRPSASMVRTPAGTATPVPAATTRPPRMTTVPPSTGPDPSPMTRRALVIATSCAAAGSAKAVAARSAASFSLKRLISRLPRRAGPARNRIPGAGAGCWRRTAMHHRPRRGRGGYRR